MRKYPHIINFKLEKFVHFPEVNISDMHYDVTVMAYSLDGKETESSAMYFDILEVNPSFFSKCSS